MPEGSSCVLGLGFVTAQPTVLCYADNEVCSVASVKTHCRLDMLAAWLSSLRLSLVLLQHAQGQT